MKTTSILILALCIGVVLADGFHSRRSGRQHGRRARVGRNRGRSNNFRFFPRRGRQEDVALEAEAPINSYGTPVADPVPTLAPEEPGSGDYSYDYGVDEYDEAAPVDNGLPAEAPLDTYGNGNINGGSGLNGNGGGLNGNGGDSNIAMLEKSVPGVPGQDYPIYSEVPETAFTCNGQVEGGYYADVEAQCQVFHICTADGFGGLAKYSFLCPNGTIFNQNYFICDWWFNFDCAEAESLYSRNDEIRAEQEANIGAVSPDDVATPAPAGGDYDANGGDYYDDYNGVAPVDDAPLDVYGTGVPPTVAPETFAEEAPALYGVPEAAPLDAAAAESEAERAARRFRNRSRGRSGRRRNNRRLRGRSGRRLNSRRSSRRGRRFQG